MHHVVGTFSRTNTSLIISAIEKSEVGNMTFITTLSPLDFSTHAYTDQKVLSEICLKNPAKKE